MGESLANPNPKVRPRAIEIPENEWLRQRLIEHHRASGLSKKDWLTSLGFKSNSTANTTFLFSGQRGYSFPMAIRLITACNIDLSRLQAHLRKKYGKARDTIRGEGH